MNADVFYCPENNTIQDYKSTDYSHTKEKILGTCLCKMNCFLFEVKSYL